MMMSDDRVPVPGLPDAAAGQRRTSGATCALPHLLDDSARARSRRRCAAVSPINSNNCRSCGMRFTMEGTHVESGGASNGYCVASLVLGIIGIPTGCSIILPLLAILFGIIGYTQVSKNEGEGGKGMAIAGIVCGAVGLIIAILYYMEER